MVVVDHEDVPAREEAACLVARTRDLVGEGEARLGAEVVVGRGKARGALEGRRVVRRRAVRSGSGRSSLSRHRAITVQAR